MELQIQQIQVIARIHPLLLSQIDQGNTRFLTVKATDDEIDGKLVDFSIDPTIFIMFIYKTRVYIILVPLVVLK